MEDRPQDQGVAVRVGLPGGSGLLLRVRRGHGGGIGGDGCLDLGPEGPDGAALRPPQDLPPALLGLAQAAALAVLRPLRPWPQRPCTLRTPEGPRQGWRAWNRVQLEFPAPLFRELNPAEVRNLDLPARASAWRVTLDRGALAVALPDRTALLAWLPPGDLGPALQRQGLATLVLCAPGSGSVLIRSWLDTGQEAASPLAAGAAACLWQRGIPGRSRVLVRWPCSGEFTRGRLLAGAHAIQRLHLDLWARQD
jgi:hypothetical protein